MSAYLVCCEGYQDRAFWAGWLEHLGLRSAEGEPDPFNATVRGGGDYGFRSAAGGHVRVVPCKSKENVLRAARTFLEQLLTKPYARIVLNRDSDQPEDAAYDGRPFETAVTDVILQVFGVPPARKGDSLLVEKTGTVLDLVEWFAPDRAGPGLPQKHTLERLVCAALNDAYPRNRTGMDAVRARRDRDSLGA